MMSIERWEIRFGCALGMAIYVHLTSAIAYGLWSIGVILFCMLYASMPAIQDWLDRKQGRDRLSR